MFDGFDSAEIRTRDTSIFVRRSGSGPPLLLLHGFPQTHLMWREVAPVLARHFTVVCADLRGYGRSGCPASGPDHASYSKRTMARDMIAVMETLGFRKFFVAGHDRGGRVAYRMALDHPDHIVKAAVLDVIPTSEAWHRADADFTLGFWPWSLLAQSEPLPEQILTSAAAAIIDNALDNWGSASTTFPSDIRSAYADVLRDPDHAHAICEEYRAAATLDRDHDEGDRKVGRRIVCPVLVLWSGKGPLDSWYKEDGGPIGIWRKWAVNIQGEALAGGHFFPEELPDQTAGLLSRFFTDT
ncbi:alpha/beta fold hydrolase [Aestuariivirga sp. YIM B02566]|uniref:Alpha/beta hydrolase n=1 Tax=Taklimakanibacter albus TaxID=2800327 RepID=A0ACC5RBY5_9HYPH|nr:alpha/beta hydrolase [Aestuariivirga sp. YIM B02566]MBK1870135.1 alpha/beta hydrolase [Aestuariivirga sp. YIM B02566]